MNVKPALRSDRSCLALTGLKVTEFEELVVQFAHVYGQEKIKRKKDRQVSFVAGRIGHLRTIEEKLFFVLFYLKSYPTFDVLGFFFNLDKSNSNRNVQFLSQVLQITLGRKLALPKRRINSVEEFFRFFPEAKDVFIDGTERRIQRPKDKKSRDKLYSGKRKTHTRKNVIVSDEKRKVLVLTPSKSGRRHDKRLLDKSGVSQSLPSAVTAWVDTGFQGLQNIHRKTQIPKKKTKNRPLTDQEKEDNRIISSFRVIGEHALAGIKRLNCVTHVYRNKLTNLDDTFMLLATGIWNYHLSFSS